MSYKVCSNDDHDDAGLIVTFTSRSDLPLNAFSVERFKIVKHRFSRLNGSLCTECWYKWWTN